jgi:hypothetical protein
MDNNQRTMMDKIKGAYKPTLFPAIYITLIALGPNGHLWMEVAQKKYATLPLLIILSSIALITLGAIWACYFKDLDRYSDEKTNYLKHPDNYIE